MGKTLSHIRSGFPWVSDPFSRLAKWLVYDWPATEKSFYYTFQLAQEVKQNLPPQKSYLALVRQDEAEWLPFLFQRQPLVSQWGSEWLGTYDQQTNLMSRIHSCEMEQDWSCVENLISDQNYPGALITYVNDKSLNQQLLATNQWSQVYVNERYSFWMKKE